MTPKAQEYFDRKRAAAERIAADSIGQRYNIRLKNGKIFKGIIVDAAPRDAVDNGRTVEMRWTVIVRHATIHSVPNREAIVRSLPTTRR